jgi:hypothetical protein
MLYFVPGVDPAFLPDTSMPLVITEGEFKTLALWRLAHHRSPNSPRFLSVGVSGVYNWRGTIGKTVGPDGSRLDVKGPFQIWTGSLGNTAGFGSPTTLIPPPKISSASRVPNSLLMPAGRFPNACDIIVAAGFQQQDVHFRIFRETTRHDRSGGARSAYDEVVLRFQPGSQALLVAPHTLSKFHSGWIRLNTCIHFCIPPLSLGINLVTAFPMPAGSAVVPA